MLDYNPRSLTEKSLVKTLDKIHFFYMKIYDEYYSNGSRDTAFLKDLVDSLIGIETVLEIYVENKGINPEYAIEKLTHSRNIINCAISYYENKLKKESEEE